MSESLSQYPRMVRPAPEPLGLYFRVSYNDHKALMDSIVSSGLGFHGAVFDPLNEDRHSELLDHILERRRDAILDPKTQEMGLPGAYNPKFSKLPWGAEKPHSLLDFSETNSRRLADAIAEHVAKKKYTAVLAPTHLIESANSPWLDIDIRSTKLLRYYLDKNGKQNVPILYSLATTYKAFRTSEEREIIRDKLIGIPVEALWLKIALGSSVTTMNIRNFILGAVDLHSLGVPLIGDMMGGLRGLSSLAFGATGGIAHGLMQKESFNAHPWITPPKSSESGWAQHPRVYLPTLDMFLSPKEAKAFFSAKHAKSRFGCSDTTCCPRGPRDTVNHPARHFLIQRTKEVQKLSVTPEQLRPSTFLEETVRPMSDAAIFAEKLELGENVDLKRRLENKRKVLERLRVGLGDFAKNDLPKTFSATPLRRALRG